MGSPSTLASLWAVISLRTRNEVSVKHRIQAIRGCCRTFLCPCHTSEGNLPSLDVLYAVIFHMPLCPRHSLDVHPRPIQVTVSQVRGDHVLLRSVSESNIKSFFCSPLHSHLTMTDKRQTPVPCILRCPNLVAVSNPSYHVSPPPRPA